MTNNNPQKVRRDMSRFLFHFTKKPKGSKDTAYDVLQKILMNKCIRGGKGFIKGSYHCVCFTEAPIAELALVFALQYEQQSVPRRDRPAPYEPYGIALTKEWLFKKGGRPVIYQPDCEYQKLRQCIQWRHKRYELCSPRRIDFTWEREWRHLGNLQISPDSAFVVVPTKREARQINCQHSSWPTVSLELLGLQYE